MGQDLIAAHFQRFFLHVLTLDGRIRCKGKSRRKSRACDCSLRLHDTTSRLSHARLFDFLHTNHPERRGNLNSPSTLLFAYKTSNSKTILSHASKGRKEGGEGAVQDSSGKLHPQSRIALRHVGHIALTNLLAEDQGRCQSRSHS